MNKIKVLDSITISKIAAGEVIERPASIVKELVENSLDAGATQIIVETQDAGKSLIRVTDNGEGMDKEDLLIAFERHTTSKLSSAEDLENISTLGFRGEALSSIAAVSKMEVMTRTDFSSSGTQAKVENAAVIGISPAGTPVGTTMIVRELFQNVPVRRRFLKSNSTEDGQIGDILVKLAIGNPGTSFKYIKDSKIIFSTNGKGDAFAAIFQLLGRDVARGLIPFSLKSDKLSIDGFISNNNLYRGNRNHQYLFVNGRYVVDYRLSRIVEQQYSSIIPINRYPLFVLYLHMDPADLDVNIHPTKQEIRFSSDSKIYEAIELGFKDSFRELLRIPEVRNESFRQNKSEKEAPKLWELSSPKNEIEQVITNSALIIRDYTAVDYEKTVPSDNENSIRNGGNKESSVREEINFEALNPIGVIFDTYIITEDRQDGSMWIIDQHAAHERIMYERLKADFLSESISVQQLLSPIVIELTPGEYRKTMDNLEFFNLLGFETEAFGDRSIILRGVPMIFGSPDGRGLFIEILDGLEEGLTLPYEIRLDRIMKIACTKAVKAGDKLDNREIDSLLTQLMDCENPLTCPHGRPTVVKMTRQELEKKFLRIM